VIEGTPVTGYFGEQRSVNGGPPAGHHGGTDLGAFLGEPAMATAPGTVVLAEALAVRGRTVIIDHGGGLHSAYAHLETLLVAAGEPVTAGQVIGLVGSTGYSSAAHLHWELAVHGVLVDGLRWLDGSQGF
jgi:murein DD-endopeptidase MepM/ murein hydrolase activator NlpD